MGSTPGVRTVALKKPLHGLAPTKLLSVWGYQGVGQDPLSRRDGQTGKGVLLFVEDREGHETLQKQVGDFDFSFWCTSISACGPPKCGSDFIFAASFSLSVAFLSLGCLSVSVSFLSHLVSLSVSLSSFLCLSVSQMSASFFSPYSLRLCLFRCCWSPLVIL